jgi:hypothetical protein
MTVQKSITNKEPPFSLRAKSHLLRAGSAKMFITQSDEISTRKSYHRPIKKPQDRNFRQEAKLRHHPVKTYHPRQIHQGPY